MPIRRTSRLWALPVLFALLPWVWSTAGAECSSTLSVAETLRVVNAERAQGAMCANSTGLALGMGPAAPLRWSPGLAAVAAAHSDEMSAMGRMSHRDDQNRALAARLSAEGYRFSMAVENVAVGYSSLDAVMAAWLASSSHCANLMNATVREVGLACSDASPDAQDRYWTLVLGAPSR